MVDLGADGTAGVCRGRMAGCRRRYRGRRLRGRWMRTRWEICAGIWRITYGAIRGLGRPRPGSAGKAGQVGNQVFGSVFDTGPSRFAYERARDRGLELVFRSAEPGLLGLPRELIRDGAGPVALGAGGISRSLPVAGGAERSMCRADGCGSTVIFSGRDPGREISNGGPAAAVTAGRGPRRGRPDRAAPPDI